MLRRHSVQVLIVAERKATQPYTQAMDYSEAVAWLLGMTNFERAVAPSSLPEGDDDATPIATRRWNLDRVHELLRRLGNPHVGPVTLHVAGTKGKGSTCAMLAAALTTAGYRTGLFTSPHLHTIRERIAINGYLCSEQDIVDAAITVRPAVEAVNSAGSFGEITTFEALTAMAFVTFATNNVEMQVIEVGLGGRLDSTNVVEPAVTGITSISLDHEAFLGSTIREIATEKAGIIKPGVPVVSAPQESDAADVIVARSAELGAPLTLLRRDVFWRRDFAALSGQDFTMWGNVGDRPIEHSLRTSLLGEHQLENASLAMAMLERLRDLHYPVPYDDVYTGFSGVRWPGRVEILSESPLIVADGAHNPYSAARLAETIKETFPGREVQLVLGAASDKDVGGIAREIGMVATGAFATASRSPRAMSPDDVADKLWEAGVPVRPEPTVAAAIERARIEGGPSSLVLVTGSLFVVAEAREHILAIKPDESAY